MQPKTSDGIVDPRTILDCLLQLQRQGTLPAMKQLEATEPELANYLFENLSSIHQELSSGCISTRSTRRIYRHIELVIFVCIQSLRHSHFELWQRQMDEPLSRDPGTPPV